MLMKMRSKMQNQKGFTLVELMVVVVILGVLVAIAVPIYNNVSDNAKEKACFANQRTIEGSAQMWVADDSAHTIAGLDGAIDADHPLIADDYLNAIPECPNQTAGSYTLTAGIVTGFPTGCNHGHF